MKSWIGRVGLGAVMAVAACSSSGRQRSLEGGSSATGERVGTVGLSLVPVAGITVNNVSFVVAQGTTTISQGVLPTPGTAASLSFAIPLPVGTGYTLSLSGESAETGDDITCTGSFGPFAVMPNSSTAFNLTLTCVDNSNGQILSTVDVETDACPRLVVDYVVATPSFADVEAGLIGLSASAHDLDNPAAAITYAWSLDDPLAGRILPPTMPITAFECDSDDFGNGTKITVTANNGACSKSLSTLVSCGHFYECGNGILDPNESCDPELDPTCPTDCTRVCGDGVAEPGEECDVVPPNPSICDPATCQFVDHGFCGDGVVGFMESCDDGNTIDGDGCQNDCTYTDTVFCGNQVQQTGEECDDGLGSALCSGECERLSTQPCLDCENAGDCFEFVENCQAFAGADRTLCNDVLQCVQDTNCYDGTDPLGFCFCGDVPASSCGAAPLNGPGSPNGACKSLIVQGLAPVTTSAQVLGLLTATSHPAGSALARLQCQKTANGSACLDICGFTAGGPVFP